MLALGVLSFRLLRRTLAGALALLVGALAFGATVPAGAGHPATDIHVDAAHGPHDGCTVQTDDGLASRQTATHALPARHQSIALRLTDLTAAHGDAPEPAPGHPPPRHPLARSPPRSV